MEKSLTASEVYKIAKPFVKPRFIEVDVEKAYDDIANRLSSQLRDEQLADSRFRLEQVRKKHDAAVREKLSGIKTIDEVRDNVHKRINREVLDSGDLENLTREFMDDRLRETEIMYVVADQIYLGMAKLYEVLPETNQQKKLTRLGIEKAKKQIMKHAANIDYSDPRYSIVRTLRDDIFDIINNETVVDMIEFQKNADGKYVKRKDKKAGYIPALRDG